MRFFGFAPTLDKGRVVLQGLTEDHFKWLVNRYSEGLTPVEYLGNCQDSKNRRYLPDNSNSENTNAGMTPLDAPNDNLNLNQGITAAIDRRNVLRDWNRVRFPSLTSQTDSSSRFRRALIYWTQAILLKLYKVFFGWWLHLLYIDRSARFSCVTNGVGCDQCSGDLESAHLPLKYRKRTDRREITKAYSQQWFNNWNVVAAELVRFRGIPKLSPIHSEYTSLSDIYHSLGASRTAFFCSWWTLFVFECIHHQHQILKYPGRTAVAALFVTCGLILGCVFMHWTRRVTEFSLLSRLTLTMRNAYPKYCEPNVGDPRE
jgi:hypothetical protein